MVLYSMLCYPMLCYGMLCHSILCYTMVLAIPELCENNNGGCEHFCHVVGGDVHCSCTDGYFLSADEKSCHSNGEIHAYILSVSVLYNQICSSCNLDDFHVNKCL